MKLSVIILTWNSRHFLGLCLDSLITQIGSIQKEIIIVDNGSVDGSVQYIEKEFPQAILLKNRKNLGVGPARNQGFNIAKGDFILILDVDTFVHKDAIQIMLRTIEQNPCIGVVGPKLIDQNGKPQFSCRNFPTFVSKIYRQLPQGLQGIFLRNEELRDWNHDSLREVGYLIGACQLIRRSAIYDVGLYDPRMFYGAEEVDFCLRSWKKGWRIVYNPEAVITHIEQRIGHKHFFCRLQLKHIKSLFLYFCKHRYLFRAPKIEDFTQIMLQKLVS